MKDTPEIKIRNNLMFHIISGRLANYLYLNIAAWESFIVFKLTWA